MPERDAGRPLRVVVIGTSGAGKTTLARRLAERYGLEHIELDDLHWLPGWRERPNEEMRKLVERAIAADRWAVSGNYGFVRDIIWRRATHLIWLNYSFPLVFTRAFLRSLRRAWTREPLFAGNVESWRQTFLSRDSILWWVITTYRRRRREYPKLLYGGAYPQLRVLELRSPREAEGIELLEHE